MILAQAGKVGRRQFYKSSIERLGFFFAVIYLAEASLRQINQTQFFKVL
jgi:hypothetical protein